jgi:hypothetical protein
MEDNVPRKKTRLVIGILVVGIVAAVAIFHGLIPAGLSQEANLRLANVLAPQALAAAASGSCQPDHPAFYYGFADLRAQLGNVMGNPTECEHAIHVDGDTRQRTTTGYAYYRKSDNVPTFTNGWDHWALTADGLVHWSGYVVDPPTARAAS